MDKVAMILSGKRFLVIGGAGFIGSHVVEELLKEDVAQVVIYDNFSRGRMSNLTNCLKDPRATICEFGGDIIQTDILGRAMEGVDGVFHLAALWLLHCHEFPRSAFEVNIRGTFNVLEACINKHVKKIVLSSSASVYGNAVQEPMPEDHPYNNENFYGATKIAGEHMARALFHRWKRTDKAFDYAGLRYMNVFGPRQDYRGAYVAVLMKMLDRIEQGLPLVIYGDGSQSYDFVHVRDCASANVLAMKSDVTDEFFNVGTGTKTSIRELAEVVLEITGSKVGIVYEEGGTTFVKNRVGSTVKAERLIGFKANLDLAQGIRDLIAWREEDKSRVV